ncbi:MAG: hypothetical protein ACKVWV_00030 [Planctomycetota bacterium]
MLCGASPTAVALPRAAGAIESPLTTVASGGALIESGAAAFDKTDDDVVRLDIDEDDESKDGAKANNAKAKASGLMDVP